MSAAPTLGLAHFSAIAVPPLDFVSLAADAGFSAVGLRLHPAFPGAPTYELPAGSDASRAVRRRLAETGLTVHDIEFVVIGPDFVPGSLVGVLEAAAALGARRLSVCGDDPDRARLIDNFAALCGLAGPYGMGVDLENMGWRRIASFADSLSLVAAAGQANGGALVDALHFLRNGAHPADLAAAPGAAIRSAQLCDAGPIPPVTPDGMVAEARSGRCAPGAGHLPLIDLVRALPGDVAIGVEVPLTGSTAPLVHARRLFETASAVLAAAARAS